MLYNRARILQEVDEDASIPVYERAANLAEHDGRPVYNLGNIYWRRGERERAISAYEQAIATDPAFPSPYHNLGATYEEMGEMERAIELWQSAGDRSVSPERPHRPAARRGHRGDGGRPPRGSAGSPARRSCRAGAQDAVVEGTLDVERVPAWGKVRADSDLRLGVVSGKPRLRGLIFFLHLDDGRNLLVLGLSERGAVETLDGL